MMINIYINTYIHRCTYVLLAKPWLSCMTRNHDRLDTEKLVEVSAKSKLTALRAVLIYTPCNYSYYTSRTKVV